MDEPVLDPSADEPTDAQTAPEPEPEPAAFSLDDPAQIEALLGNPAVQDFLDRRAASIVDTRMASYTPPGKEPEGGQPVDLNEFLNPLGDNFGQNLATFLSQRDQWFTGQIDERLQPILSSTEAEQIKNGHARMDELIAQSWNESRDGKLTDPAKTAIRDLAPSYLPEMEQMYGAGPLAAEKALGKAAATIRAINAASHAAGGQANVDQLAAVRNLPGAPAGGGAIDLPTKARTPDELLARRFGLTAA